MERLNAYLRKVGLPALLCFVVFVAVQAFQLESASAQKIPPDIERIMKKFESGGEVTNEEAAALQRWIAGQAKDAEKNKREEFEKLEGWENFITTVSKKMIPVTIDIKYKWTNYADNEEDRVRKASTIEYRLDAVLRLEVPDISIGYLGKHESRIYYDSSRDSAVEVSGRHNGRLISADVTANYSLTKEKIEENFDRTISRDNWNHRGSGPIGVKSLYIIFQNGTATQFSFVPDELETIEEHIWNDGYSGRSGRSVAKGRESYEVSPEYVIESGKAHAYSKSCAVVSEKKHSSGYSVGVRCENAYTASRTLKESHINIEFGKRDEDVIVEVTSRTTGSPHCSCKNFEPLEFTAAANKKGGTFQKFIVESPGTKPEIVKNEGGDRPRLIIKGAGWKTGKTLIQAVYKIGNNTYLSKPYEMNFCDDIKKPGFKGVPHMLASDPNEESFIFDERTPGTLEIIAVTYNIWVNEKEIKENLKWDISPNNGMFAVEVKQSAGKDGHIAKFRADRMPEKNDDFGKKYIWVEFKNEQCECRSEKTEAKIFFIRDADNNPGGIMPNWAYYWSQTKAGVPGVPFKVVKTMPPIKKQSGCLGADVQPGDPKVPAQYDYFEDILYLTERVAQIKPSGCMDRPSRLDPTQRGEIEDRGIDCFAVSLRHENQHKTELSRWWGPKMSNYSCLADLDGDLVPNSVEDKTPGCNKLSRKSCPGRPAFLHDEVMDMEFTAYNVGWQWKPGSADKEDWGCPGKQCPGHNY